jgi:hypothetical protein
LLRATEDADSMSVIASHFETFAHAARAAFAGGFVMAGATPGPRGEMPRGREAGHVGPDLGQDDFGGAPVDTREGVEQLDLRRQRGEALLDLPRQPLDGVLEVLNVREQFPDDERMVRAEAPLQGLAQLGELLAQLAAGEVGQRRRIPGALDESGEHRPAGDAEDFRGDRAPLDAGVLKDLVEALDLAGAFLDERLAVAGEPGFIVPLLRNCRES